MKRLILIIAVLIIIVVVSYIKNSNNESKRRQKQYTAAARKTNAKMERDLVDYHMKHGKSFDDAFELARQDVLKGGFEPCIPKNAYKSSLCEDELSGTPYESSECPDCDKYDSDAVKHLKSDYQMQCRKRGVKWSREGEIEYVYGDNSIPTTPAEYATYLNHLLTTHQYESIAVGEFFSYLGLGTCEVISLDFERAMHTVKVIGTGEIKQIPFGDKKITRL